MLLRRQNWASPSTVLLCFSLSTELWFSLAAGDKRPVMPKWGKSRAKDDLVDDGSEDGRPAKKVARKETDDSDGITVCELSGHRKVSVRSWRGQIYVDIREFYTKDGKEMPGKKGISLSLDQWEVLRDNMEVIDEAVQESG